MPETSPPPPAATRRIPIAIGAVLAVAVIGAAGVYGIGGLKRGAAAMRPAPAAVDLAKKNRPSGPWRGGRA